MMSGCVGIYICLGKVSSFFKGSENICNGTATLWCKSMIVLYEGTDLTVTAIVLR